MDISFEQKTEVVGIALVTLNEGDRFVFLNCDYTSWPDGQMVEESFICNYYESNTVYRNFNFLYL